MPQGIDKIPHAGKKKKKKKNACLSRQELCCAPHPRVHKTDHGLFSLAAISKHFVCVSLWIFCTKSRQGDFSIAKLNSGHLQLVNLTYAAQRHLTM